MSSKVIVPVSDVVSLSSQILDEMKVDYEVKQASNSEFKATIHVNAREVDAVKMEIYKRLPQMYVYEVFGDLKEESELKKEII